MYVSCLVHELISSWNLKSLQFKRLLLLGQLVAYIVDIYTSLLVIVRCRAIVHSFFNIYLCVCTNRIYVEFQCVKLLNEESVKMKLCHWTTRRRNHFARFFFFSFFNRRSCIMGGFPSIRTTSSRLYSSQNICRAMQRKVEAKGAKNLFRFSQYLYLSSAA